jgi:hypothetical protein
MDFGLAQINEEVIQWVLAKEFVALGVSVIEGKFTGFE